MNIEEIKNKYPEIPLGRAKDLTNQKFGKLTVLYRTIPPNDRGTYWVCKCDCGKIKSIDAISLIHNRSKSCGCSIQDNAKRYIDSMIGTKINSWVIINKDENNDKNWLFKCSCGSNYIKSMRLDSARTSLGCPNCSTAKNKLIDLTGQKFGHWTVLAKGEIKNKHIMWVCQCDCINHTIREVDGYKLRKGISTSCGCQHFSKGEEKIKQLLSQYNIPFETQKMFKTCKTSEYNYAKFDFYVNKSYVIEYDGEQHFKVVTNGWNDPIKLAKTQERDRIKNQWCKENNIPLIRIPYTRFNNLCLEDLLLETSNYVVV